MPRFNRSCVGALLLTLLALPWMAHAQQSANYQISHLVPTPQQARYMDLEYGMFVHFSMPTFLGEEFPDGAASPDTFNPTNYDPVQWVQIAKNSGMKYLVLTSRHLEGFSLWPTDVSSYSVKNSSWKNGQGDVIRDVADACRAAGIQFGLYMSIENKHEPAFTNLDPNNRAYDEFMKAQLRELSSRYGDILLFWFDPASNVPGRWYDVQGYFQAIAETQPNALTAIAGKDIRWVGNEDGVAPETFWNVIPHFLENNAYAFYPAEADTTTRTYDSHGKSPSWFWLSPDQQYLRSEESLINIYQNSVGRGVNLLLNVGPDRTGRIPPADAERVQRVGRLLSRNYNPYRNFLRGHVVTASGSDGDAVAPQNAIDGDLNTYWMGPKNSAETWIEVDMGRPTWFNRSIMQEMTTLGQRVDQYLLQYWDGVTWQDVNRGAAPHVTTTIGHKKIDSFPDVVASRVRLTLHALPEADTPTLREFGVYRWMPLPGDVNGDSVIDVKDVIAVLQHVAGRQALPPEAQQSADVVADGQINVMDVIKLLRETLGLGNIR